MEYSSKQIAYLIKNDISLWEGWRRMLRENFQGEKYWKKIDLSFESGIYQFLEGQRSTLLNEIQIMKKIKGVKGVPKMKSHGKWDYGYYLELSLLQSSLYDERAKQFSISQINLMAKELIDILKQIHNLNVIHQDIKPQNIMKDFEGNYTIIDFGLSHFKTGRKQRASGFIGTPRYASIAAHRGTSQGKKDDIESLLYVLAFMYLKKLPWSEINVPKEKKLSQIQKLKQRTSKQVFATISRGFTLAYEYVNQLGLEQIDYGYLISLFSHQRSTMSPISFQPPKEMKDSSKSSRRTTSFLRLKNETKNIVINKSDKTLQNQKYNLGYSEMAQYGYIEIIQALTSKFLKSTTGEASINNYQQFSYDVQENNQPELNNLEKYSGDINFKNPFIYDRI